MPVAIYLRKSRTEELGEPVEATLKRHYEQLLEFARKSALDVTGLYEEVVSGETLCSRPQMLRLLADVEAGQYDAVLCMDIDRLGRGSMSDQGVILETLKKAGTRIITPRKVYDLNNDLDETYSEFETFMARQELKQIKRRLNRGLQKTIQDGGYIANAPYGYRKALVNKLPSLEIVEEEAYFVRMIFDLYVNEGAGSQIIAETISNLGAKPHRSERFARTSVRKILKNPVYTGKIVWNQVTHIKKGTRGSAKSAVVYNPPDRWTYADGLHPPIVSEELFSRAQTILSGRHHPPYYKGTVENPLAGLVRCGNCGAAMQRRVSGKTSRVAYLICPNTGCIQSTQHAFVEEAVLSALRDRFAQLPVEAQTQPLENTSVLEHALASVRKETGLAVLQKARLHDLLEQGIYDSGTFFERAAALDEKLRLLRLRESAQECAIARASGSHREKDLRPRGDVLQAYCSADAQIRNQLLKTALSGIVYYKEKKSRPHEFSLVIGLRDF